MNSLGHHLEEEIASKELWQEQCYKLHKSKKLYNNTDRRKLSEARVLGRAELISLRDARLEKDKKKPPTLVRGTPVPKPSTTRAIKPTHKAATAVTKTPATSDSQVQSTPLPRGPRAKRVTIAATPLVLVIDSENDSSFDVNIEELSHSEWATNSLTSSTFCPHGQTLSHPPSPLLPLPAFTMCLRSRPSPSP